MKIKTHSPIILEINCSNKKHVVISPPSQSVLKRATNEQIDNAYNYAKTSLAIEGQYTPRNSEGIIRKRLSGEITQDEFRRLALEIATGNHV